MGNTARVKKAWLWLLLLYAAVAAVRFSAALAFTANPILMPDESLYLNLSRSIWNGGGLVHRNHPIFYANLLYPLVLSPLFALPSSVNLYRAVQLVNVLMMASALFPAFLLAKRITRNEKTALLVCCLVALVPDGIMTEVMMIESLSTPLLLWTFLGMHRVFASEKERDAVLVAAGCFLLYFCKVGLIAVFVAFMLLLLGQAAAQRDRRKLRVAIVAGLTFLAMFIVSRALLTSSLGLDYSLPSIYKVQEPVFSVATVLKSLNGMLLYAMFIPIALLIFPVLMPLAYFKGFDKPGRALLLILAASTVFIVIGVCYVVYLYEYTGQPFSARIHLRYVAPFFPALLPFAFAPQLRDKRLSMPLAILLGMMLAAIAVFTMGANASRTTNPIDALSLSAILIQLDWTQPKVLFQFLFAAWILVGGLFLYRYGWTSRVRRSAAAALALFFVVTNMAGYERMRQRNDPLIAADAMEINRRIEARDMLYIAQDLNYFSTTATALDVHSRTALRAVELADLMGNTAKSGVYLPFTPQKHWKTYRQNPTPDAKWLIMDAELLNNVTLAQGVGVAYTKNARYAIVTPVPGKSWVHSAMSGLDKRWVSKSSLMLGDSMVSVFDETLTKQTSIVLRLHARAEKGTATLTLSCGEFAQSFPIGDTLEWISATIPQPALGEPIRVKLSSQQKAFIETYRVK